MKITKIDLFRPESFIVFYLLFLLLAGSGFMYWKNIARPSVFGIVFVLASVSVFYAGACLSKKVRLHKISEYVFFPALAFLILYYGRVISNFFAFPTLTSIFISATLAGIFYTGFKKLTERETIPLVFHKGLVVVGLAFLALTFYQVGGVPLFNSALRLNLKHSFAWTGAVFFFLFGYVGLILNVKKKSHAYALIAAGTLLFALTGFRIA
ncbi:MAG: hypothetical protein ABIF92_02570, partial [archaeon]